MTSLTLQPALELTDEQFYQICQQNRELKLEKTASGELIIMPPTGGTTGNRNIRIAAQLGIWSDRNDSGLAFDSSTCFKLPNGAQRSPDAAWVARERWDALSQEQQEKFPPLCPDFVIELRSNTDTLKSLQDKMQEYQENGAKLGWLIDPQNRQVEICRSGREPDTIQNPETLSGEAVLPGFVLDLRRILT